MADIPDIEDGRGRQMPKDFREDEAPSLQASIRFWIWSIISWSFYVLLTLIYLPWSIAMHIVILALLIVSSPALYWPIVRKIHLYAYVVVVMVPGKFLWYNLFRYNRRRSQLWEYEMGKPKTVKPHRRRRISESDGTNPQLRSPLFNKLPAEVRLKIYKHAIVGEDPWFFISDQGNSSKKTRDTRYRAYSIQLPDEMEMNDLSDSAKTMRKLFLLRELRNPRERLQTGQSLLRSCKQTYRESINMFYTLPTFCFGELHRPPFFLRTVLPERLALIRSVHLLYDQDKMIMRRNHVACSTAKFNHEMGRCPFCNTTQWFKGVSRYLTNLQEISIFLILKKDQRIPDLGQDWIHNMLKLQKGPNGLREIYVDVKPNYMQEVDREFSLEEEEFTRRVEKFRVQLVQRLEKAKKEYIKANEENPTGQILASGKEERQVNRNPLSNTSEVRVEEEATIGVG